MSATVPTVLLVEDDAVDAKRMKRLLTGLSVPHQFVWAQDGETALARLLGTDGAPALARPVLMLLDLNLPRRNGVEVLAALAEHSRLVGLRVVVLSSSDEARDRRAVAAYGVVDYWVKDELDQRAGQLGMLLREMSFG